MQGMPVPRKLLNIRILVTFFNNFRKRWDHKSTHTYTPFSLLAYVIRSLNDLAVLVISIPNQAYTDSVKPFGTML